MFLQLVIKKYKNIFSNKKIIGISKLKLLLKTEKSEQKVFSDKKKNIFQLKTKNKNLYSITKESELIVKGFYII